MKYLKVSGAIYVHTTVSQLKYCVLSRDIKRIVVENMVFARMSWSHTEHFPTKFVQFRFMSVIPSYFVRKSPLFGRSNDSECSIFDETRYLEKVEGYLAHDDISWPRYSGQMIGWEVWLKRA